MRVRAAFAAWYMRRHEGMPPYRAGASPGALRESQLPLQGAGKIPWHFHRKFLQKIIKNREIPLDRKGDFLYYYLARVKN